MSEAKVTAENLNYVMSFDHVIRVNEDGTVSDVEESYYFDVRTYKGDDEVWTTEYVLPEGWTVMNGYSGQQGYAGPDMHQSEYISGGMARDILATPGLYVALTVEADCGYTEDGCDEESGCNCEPESWVVATKPAD